MRDWEDDAACRGKPISLFFPEDGSRRDQANGWNVWRRAKRVCAKCPVRRDCLEAALRHEEPVYKPAEGRWSRPLPFGVWGGHNPRERHLTRIRHYDVKETSDSNVRCVRKGCRGCRPIPERIELLEELFAQQVHTKGLLTPSERIRG